MLIAVTGCTHGEVEKTYQSLAELQRETNKSVDLLLCCGDFQSTRNIQDLKCMAVPDKYKSMCSFYKYYSGECMAPVLTIFIGGNHEASNFLQELPFGGWVAPNIYYMGYSSIINVVKCCDGKVERFRIGGMSGIYKSQDYLKGRYEVVPYDSNSIRSVYHVRNIDSFRFRQISVDTSKGVDIMLSHDWPQGIHMYGDVDLLLRQKKFLRNDIENNCLGSKPAMDVLNHLRPKYWFSAHLHVKFSALFNSEKAVSKKTSGTRFLALDKSLPNRQFLQLIPAECIIEASSESLKNGVHLEYDLEWIKILRETEFLDSFDRNLNHMPGPNAASEKYEFKSSIADLEKFQISNELVDLKIPENFGRNCDSFDASSSNGQSFTKLLNQCNPPSKPLVNPQTETFCSKFKLKNPQRVVLEALNRTKDLDSSYVSRSRCNTLISASVGEKHEVNLNDQDSTFLSVNEDEISIQDNDTSSDDELENCCTNESDEQSLSSSVTSNKRSIAQILPPPSKHVIDNDLIDDNFDEDSRNKGSLESKFPVLRGETNVNNPAVVLDTNNGEIEKKDDVSDFGMKKMKRRNANVYCNQDEY